jgi:antagonist of KipI
VLHLGVAAKKNTQRISAHLRAEYSAGHPHQDAPPLLAPQWSIADHLLDHWPVLNIPVLRGRHFDYLDTTQRQLLLGEKWQIDARSNRQGLALNGPTLKTTDMPQILSEPVRYGTVQLPSGGKPFILMSEHQTTGGYPRILEIVSAARPLLAQASPESRIRFVEVDLAIANNLNAASQRNRQLKYLAIQERLSLT